MLRVTHIINIQQHFAALRITIIITVINIHLRLCRNYFSQKNDAKLDVVELKKAALLTAVESAQKINVALSVQG